MNAKSPAQMLSKRGTRCRSCTRARPQFGHTVAEMLATRVIDSRHRLSNELSGGGPLSYECEQNALPAVRQSDLVSFRAVHCANLEEMIPIKVPATKNNTIIQRPTGPAAYLSHGQNGGKKLQTFERVPSASHIQQSMRTQPARASTMAAFSICGRVSGVAEVMAVGRRTAQITSATTSQSIRRIGRDLGVSSGIGFMLTLILRLAVADPISTGVPPPQAQTPP